MGKDLDLVQREGRGGCHLGAMCVWSQAGGLGPSAEARTRGHSLQAPRGFFLAWGAVQGLALPSSGCLSMTAKMG